VEKAKLVENLKSSSKAAKPRIVGRPTKCISRYEGKKKPYSRPQPFSSGGPNPQLPLNVKCFRCGGPHMIRFSPHPAPNMICRKCHRYDHVTKDCCTKLEAPNVNGGQQVHQDNN